MRYLNSSIVKSVLQGVIFGIIVWMIDVILDYLFFFNGDFIYLLQFDVTSHEMYVRFLIVIGFAMFGLLIGIKNYKLKAVQFETVKKNDLLTKSNLLLAKSKNKFKRYIEGAPIGIFVSDAEGNYLEVNQLVCDLTGYSKQELLQMKMSDFTQKDAYDLHQAHFAKSYMKSKCIGDFPYVKKDGEIGWWSQKTIKVENDKIIGFVTDISKQFDTETKLRAFYSVLADIPNVAVQGYNKERAVIYWNKASEEIYGYTKEEALGKTIESLIVPSSMRDIVIWGIKDWYDKSTPIPHGELILIRKNKTLVHVYSSYVMVERMDGSREMFCVHVDITPQKEIEYEMIEAKERAEQADRLKSAFLANMSHEIRTPMNGILGFAELLKQPGVSKIDKESYVEVIQKSGARMLETINDIIDVSKIDSGQVEVSITEVDVCEELQSAYDFFLPEAKNKGLAFCLSNQISKSETKIATDRIKFNSIVTNLIKNAIKYTNKGKIEISCNKIEESLICEVKDTGIGIPDDKINDVFKRFEQVNSENKRAIEGDGLGLSIAKSYTEMLGGEIYVSSKLGLGSKFTFVLPWNSN